MQPEHAPAADESAERRAALARLRRFGGERLVRNMAALFLDALPERLDAARRAAAADDAAALAAAAHSLRSSCAQFGAGEAARLCAAVEGAAERGDRRAAATLVAPMAAACESFRAWLVAELAEGPAAAEAPR